MWTVHTILHATDFSAAGQHALEVACALARDHGARLILLHVRLPEGFVKDLEPVPLLPGDVRKIVERALGSELAGEELDVEYRVEEGDPIELILNLAAETGCDLIVLGTHGRTGLGRLLRGSIAEDVVRRAPCPVVTVKTRSTLAASSSSTRTSA